MRIYGLKTCDNCRKALKDLSARGREVEFVDVRADGLTEAQIGRFLAIYGDRLVNRSSTTWRGLSEEERSGDPAALIARYPTLMKRPVIEDGETLWLGWSDETRAALLG